MSEFLERRIVTGLIVSADYVTRIRPVWDSSLLESPELKLVADCCIEYFDKYGRPPLRDIENIYETQLKPRLSRSEAKYVENLLYSLSDEYERSETFNAAYLFDQTMKYLRARELVRLNEEVQELIAAGRVDEAEQLTKEFRPRIADVTTAGVELSSEEGLAAVERAFMETGQRVLSYPGALGEMWNEHLVRGGFVALLAPEKRGKTFMLLEMALRGVRQRSNVAFFEAGDMTETQIIRRICIYLARTSDRERYCRERYVPVEDCVLNQLDLCTRDDRNCSFGLYKGLTVEKFFRDIQRLVTLENLSELYETSPDYRPCNSYICDQRIGTVWVRKVPATRPLTGRRAREVVEKFFQRYRRRFKLLTSPAGTLSVTDIRNVLDEWERLDGFVPDIVVVDYADLLSADDSSISEFRHRQDHIWKSLRALSQERHVLVLTATQADAESYRQDRLTPSNFSEDKRKMAHVTAMYGLNQDPHGREKRLGLLRINEIVVREGAFANDNEVCVLQDLAAGRPFLGSYHVKNIGTPE